MPSRFRHRRSTRPYRRRLGTKRSHDLYRSAVSLFFIYLAMNYLSEVVSNLYAASGTACSSASMQKVLWFFLFLSSCRFIRATILILRFEPAYAAIAVAMGHVWLQGRVSPSNELNEVVKTLLLDAKLVNYGLHYFVLSPTVLRAGLPTRDRVDSASGKKRAFCMMLFALRFGVPAVFPDWFNQSFRCSETPKRPIIGPGMDISLLSTHLKQLSYLASC